MIFLSTPSARRATDALPTLSTAWMISIHALREEGDSGSGSSAADSYNISIHALREEGDTINQLRQAFQIQFLSTPSARRATESQPGALMDQYHFYPRPPRGGRLMPLALVALASLFLSTPSARRATRQSGPTRWAF